MSVSFSCYKKKFISSYERDISFIDSEIDSLSSIFVSYNSKKVATAKSLDLLTKRMKAQMQTERLNKILDNFCFEIRDNNLLEWAGLNIENYKQRLKREVPEKQLSLNQQLINLWIEAQQCLVDFRCTKDDQYFFTFKKLLRDYYDLLLRSNNKFRKILSKLKASLRCIFFTDLRNIFRVRSKMLSRNTDDEHNSVNIHITFKGLLTQLLLRPSHEFSKHKRYNCGLRVLSN